MTNPSWDPGGTYTLVFDDEFTGSSLDTTKWTAGWQATSGISGPINSAETAAYNSTHVSVSGGYLNLQLTQTAVTSGGTNYAYTGACVTTNPTTLGGSNGFAQEYGAFEARIWLPETASGDLIANWPAFWLDGQSWPTDGENDILEGLQGVAQFHYDSTLAQPSIGGPAQGQGDGTLIPYFSPYAGGWHTFGCNWVAGQIDWYYDGVLVGSTQAGIPAAPEYIILNNTCGTYGGATTAPATMQVDWVRAWTSGPAAAIPPVSGLADSFTVNDVDSLWYGSYNVTVSGGQAAIACDTSYDGALATGSTYNLTGGAFWAKITNPAGTIETGMSLSDALQDSTGSNINSIDWLLAGGSLTASITQSGTTTTVATLTYSATSHAWWKVSESGGTITWWTSPDGTTWTNQGSHAHSISVTALWVSVWTGNNGAGTLTTYVDDVNGGSAGSVTSTGSAGLAALAAPGAAGPVVTITSTGSAGLAPLGASGGTVPSQMEVFADTPAAAVSSGGTDVPSAGTVETWTVQVTSAFAAASPAGSPVTFFYAADPSAPSEKFLVTSCPGGTGSQSWTAVRGADGTTPVAHAAGFAVVQVVTRASLEALQTVQGTVTLSAGTATVACSAVTAASVILLTGQADGGTPGWLRVSALTPGTSFTITSSSDTDASTVGYAITQG